MATPKGVFAGNELRDLRESLGLEQLEVAKAWGRPQPNLSEIETNRRRVSPRMKRLLIAVLNHLAAEKALEGEQDHG